MNDILKFDTISQYNAFNNHQTRHPLVSVIGPFAGRTPAAPADALRLLRRFL